LCEAPEGPFRQKVPVTFFRMPQRLVCHFLRLTLQLRVQDEEFRAGPVRKAAGPGRLSEAGNIGRCGKMGVRFYCSGCGQKLNVKAFQAGRRGLCPYCGASIDIPTKSTRPGSKRRKPPESPPGNNPNGGGGLTRQPPPRSPAGPPAGSPATGGPGQRVSPSADTPGTVATPAAPATPQPAGAPPDQDPGASPPEPQGEALPSTPAQTPAAPVGQPAGTPPPSGQPTSPPSPIGSPDADAPIRTTSASPANPPDVAGAQPHPASAPSPSPSVPESDPPAQSSDAVWYVRPASGGQFGPATGDVMRAWIAEGRVGSDSLVWREGWRDWQQAGEVFGPLGTGNPQPGLGAMGTNGGASTEAPARGTHGPSRARSVALNAAILAVLILAVVVLLGVFLWVLKRGPEPPDEASNRGPATVASAVDGLPANRSLPPAPGHPGA